MNRLRLWNAALVAGAGAGLVGVGCGPAVPPDRVIHLQATDGREYQFLRVGRISMPTGRPWQAVEYRTTLSPTDSTAMSREAEGLLTTLEAALAANQSPIALDAELIVVARVPPVNGWTDPRTLAFRVRRTPAGWQHLATLDISAGGFF